MTTPLHMDDLVKWTVAGLELAALATIVLEFALSAIRSTIFPVSTMKDGRYATFRRDVGRSTLIALEILIAADILRSLVLEPSMSNMAVLAILVAIRTFLSFSIDVEIDGCWPWNRTKNAKKTSHFCESSSVRTGSQHGRSV